jgi:D-alanyl-D-alanine-carboxypeptidase/D-alanyl-D-alanine-endopeptidase
MRRKVNFPLIFTSGVSTTATGSAAHAAIQPFRPISAMLLMVFAAWATAQQPLPLTDAELRGSTLFTQSTVTGMVLVVVRNHEVLIRGYGETAPGSGKKPNANSLVRLCSISKVFTAEMLMQMANEGRVKLSDSLQKFAPPATIVPRGPSGTPITLLNLATHTSGLPREVSSYPRNTPHFTFPDYAFRWEWLPRQRLISTPGTAALYSNVGFDLLGDALARAANKPYAQLLNERMVRPLGLRDTTLSPSPEQCARLLVGASEQGPCTDTQPSGPSGGVYSTGADMARTLEYLLHISGTGAPMGPAMRVYLNPSQLKSAQGLNHAGEATGIGLAWIQIGDPNSLSALLEKTGGGAGFSTYIALSPKTQTGIFLAVTEGKGRSQVDFYHEANNLLAAVASVPPLPPRAHVVHAARKRRARPRHPPKPAAQ